MDMIWEILGSEAAASVILILVGLFFGQLVAISKRKRYRMERALQVLEQGVIETYEDYVKGIKLGKAEGEKLTLEEIETARSMAINKAKDYAKSEGIDLLKEYAEKYLPVLLEKIVGRFKNGNA